jgi:hypothetical protein
MTLGFLDSTVWPFSFETAAALSLASLALSSSGEYFFRSLTRVRAKLKGESTLVLVEGLGELVDNAWHFDPGHKDALLALEQDVLGPSHEPGEVAPGLNITTNSVAAGPLLEQRVGHLL